MDDFVKPMRGQVCEVEAEVNERLDKIDQLWCSTVSTICEKCGARACNGAVCLLEDVVTALLALPMLEVGK